MLDERMAELLSEVCTLCKGEGFSIIEEKELMRTLPTEEGEIAKRLSALAERRLIELKYAEAGTYCVRTLSAGRSYLERARQEALEKSTARREVLFFAAIGGFIGGMVASFLVLLAGLL